MRVFALQLFLEIRKKDEVISRANTHSFALVAPTCRLSEPECRVNGGVVSILWDSTPTVVYVCHIIGRTRKYLCTGGNC